MVEMTFREYDELTEKIAGYPVPDDYDFPEEEEFEQIFRQPYGLERLLFAMEHSESKEYKKKINELLVKEISLVDDEEPQECEAAESETDKVTIYDYELKNLRKTLAKTPVSDTFRFPDVSDLDRILHLQTGIRKLIQAQLYGKDAIYRKTVTDYFNSHVVVLHAPVVEEDLDIESVDPNNLRMKPADLEKMRQKVAAIIRDDKVDVTGFLPTKEDLEEHANRPSEDNIAFLYFISSVALEEPTEETDEMQKYARALMNKLLMKTPNARSNFVE